MKIVVLDGYTANPGDNSWSPLTSLGELQVYDHTTPEQVVLRADQAEILVTNKVKLDAGLFQQLPALKFVSVLATGYDVVDVTAAKNQNVVVSNVPEYSTQSVAQHVFTGLLSLIARPESHHQAILGGQWQRSGQFSFWNTTLIELSGKTMGIVGLGKIGRAVARLAHAFGMRVVASGRSCNHSLPYPAFEWLDVETLFATADVISLHCPATTETTGMVNKRRLSMMKSTAILINTARGSLVNEWDLADALNEGVIAGAFLDVVSVEPVNSENPLLKAKNCLLTPHLSWATIEARRRLLEMTANNVAAFIQGKPINVVSQ